MKFYIHLLDYHITAYMQISVCQNLLKSSFMSILPSTQVATSKLMIYKTLFEIDFFFVFVFLSLPSLLYT